MFIPLRSGLHAALQQLHHVSVELLAAMHLDIFACDTELTHSLRCFYFPVSKTVSRGSYRRNSISGSHSGASAWPDVLVITQMSNTLLVLTSRPCHVRSWVLHLARHVNGQATRKYMGRASSVEPVSQQGVEMRVRRPFVSDTALLACVRLFAL